MSTLSQDKVKKERLLAGYFRMIESILDQDIPNEIVQIIILYQRMLLIFGIGPGSVFGGVSLEKYTQMRQLEELQCDINNICKNNRAIMMITANGELYAMGHNLGFRLGAELEDHIPLTKLKDNVKLVSNGSENDNHTFIYTQDHKLYANGYNYDGYLANGKAAYNWCEKSRPREIATKFLQKPR